MLVSRALVVLWLSAAGFAQDQQPQAKSAAEVLAATLADLRGSTDVAIPAGGWTLPETPRPPKAKAREPIVSASRLRHRVPKAAQNAYARATRWVQKKNLTKAMEEYRRAVQLDPEYAEAHGDWGVLYVSLKMYREALAEFRRTIELIPESSLAHVNLGWVLSMTGEAAEAQQSAKRALLLSDRNASAHFLLGQLLAAAPATRNEGIRHLEYAAQTMPGAADALRRLANQSRP